MASKILCESVVCVHDFWRYKIRKKQIRVSSNMTSISFLFQTSFPPHTHIHTSFLSFTNRLTNRVPQSRENNRCLNWEQQLRRRAGESIPWKPICWMSLLFTKSFLSSLGICKQANQISSAVQSSLTSKRRSD